MDQQEAIKAFMDLTHSNESASRFYLESHAWDLEDAMESFYEAQASTPSNPSTSSSSVSNPISSSSAQAPKPASKPSTSTNRGGIRSLGDLRNEEEDENSDDNVNWFTGGEKSGLQVQAPKKKKEVVDDLVEAAMKSGAKNVEEYDAEHNQPFASSGQRLGSTQGSSHPAPAPKNKERKKISLWKNGFQFDQGPLRDYNDPANMDFLNSIKNGQVPRELQRMGNDILVELEDKRSEDYKEPPKVMQAFSGSGHTLGGSSSTPAPVNNAPQQTSASSQGVSPITLDESQPVTSVQIRCGDGSKLIGKFNHTHQVKDIRRFIDFSKPGRANFELCTAFPQKPISDENQTISQAGLVNSVVVQKMK